MTLQYTFHLRGEEQDILLAQLSMIGFEGFEQFPDRLIACIDKEDFNEQEFRGIVGELPFNVEELAPRNWNAEWESSFQPVVIEEFCAVRASFHQPIEGVDHDIQITPKMSFGTGHHATTYQMIRLMKDIDFNGKTVLDFGTGTGVLAILAEKLGAAKIVAFDNDTWSIENAKENIQANRNKRISLHLDQQITTSERFQVILANINKHVILGHMNSVKQHLEQDGIVLFSGLLGVDKEEIVDAAKNVGLNLVELSMKDNWLALKMKG